MASLHQKWLVACKVSARSGPDRNPQNAISISLESGLYSSARGIWDRCRPYARFWSEPRVFPTAFRVGDTTQKAAALSAPYNFRLTNANIISQNSAAFESWCETFDRGSILLLSLPWSCLGELWIHCVVTRRALIVRFSLVPRIWLRSQVVLLHATLCTGRGKRRGLATGEVQESGFSLQTVECRPLRLTDEFISRETLGSEIRAPQLLIMVRPKRPKTLMKLQEKPNLQRHQTLFVWMTLQKN